MEHERDQDAKTTRSTRRKPRIVTLNGCARMEKEDATTNAEETKMRAGVKMREKRIWMNIEARVQIT